MSTPTDLFTGTPMGGLFTGTALIGLLTFALFQLKSVPIFIYNKIKIHLLHNVTFDNSEYDNHLVKILNSYLLLHYPKKFKSTIGETIYEQSTHGNKLVIKYTQNSNIFHIRHNGKLIIITVSRLKNEKDNISTMFYTSITLQSWFGKKEINDFLNTIIDVENKKPKSSNIYVNFNSDWSYVSKNIRKIENVVYENKMNIIDDINFFIENEDWYSQRGIPYKRGYLFYGRPGNGKTSMLMSIANSTNKDIYFLNINDIKSDGELFRLFINLSPSPILVLEDVDACFSDRNDDDAEKSSKVSFSAMLNCLDGVFSQHGTIIIMTTNHIEKLDSALIRDGRIDMKLLIDNPKKEIVEEYISLFFNEEIKLKNYNKDVSMAHIQNICIEFKDNKDKVIKLLEN